MIKSFTAGILLISLIVIAFAAGPVTLQPDILYMTQLGPVRVTSLGGGCYFPIQLSLNLTWTGTSSIYRIVTNNFWLVVTSPNVQVTNSSDSSYKNPNNQIKTFNLFPNIPVNDTLGFGPTCLPTGGHARVVYLDNKYNFTFTLV